MSYISSDKTFDNAGPFYNDVYLRMCPKNLSNQKDLPPSHRVRQRMTRKAMHCNNHDNLLHLSFVLKISLFSETSIEPSRGSMMGFFCENNKLLTIFTKKFHKVSFLCSKYASAFTWRLSKHFSSLKYFTFVNLSNMLLHI